jgi:hypothetical protein
MLKTKKTFSVKDIILYLILTISTIFFGGIISPTSIILFYIIFLSILLILKSDFILVTFIVVLFTNGYINRDEYLLGFIGIEQVVNLFALLYILIQGIPKIEIKKASKNIRIGVQIVIVLFFYTTYISFKNAYFGMNNNTIQSALFTTISFAIRMFVLVLLLYSLNKKYSVIKTGVFLAFINLIFFAIFGNYLSFFGFYISNIEDAEYSRIGGVIGNGDANTLGAVMVMFVGFLLSKFENHEWEMNHSLTIVFAIIASGLSGSRTAFMLLLFVFFLFAMRNLKSVKGLLIILLTATVFSALTFAVFDTAIERLRIAKEEQMTVDSGTSNRIGKWIFYIDEFNKDKITYIRGSDNLYSVGFKHSYRVAHNFFIQIVYNSGLLFLFLFLRIFYLCFKTNRYLNNNILYILIPLIGILMFVSDYGSIFPFVLLLGLSKQKVIKYTM